MKFLVRILPLIMLCFWVSCTPSKKRQASSRLKLPIPHYQSTPDSLPFRFQYSEQSILNIKKNEKNISFFNLHYPKLKANIYATWHRITPEKIYQFTTEAHRMAFQHTDVATDIKQQFYMNASQRNYGIIFTLEGKVATPLQIALTDSNRYFFNASLYFDQTSYHDSLKYIVDYLRIDLLKIMDTFELQSSPKK